MPIYDIQCIQCDHTERDRYFKVRGKGYGVCPACGHKMAPLLSMGVPLTKTFAEDRPYLDLHIRKDGKPQLITSWGQRERLKKDNGVEEVGARYGEKGAW